ncbi:MAG TPA: hypothetical protein VL981_02120 [Candidatus Methylacidiphilales bacterium]|nr:hypothetical protein [Candidatus Methylacidiphilales bacterium]
MSDPSPLSDACKKVVRSIRQNWPAMLCLEAAMATVVAIYYLWPAGSAMVTSYGIWLHSGGILATALAAALAGGVLSELSIVYIQNGGCWTKVHFERMLFNSVLFFISGSIVFEFYYFQAWVFGDDTGWRIVAPKLFVDQFVFTVFWATPYQALMTRWHALRYSASSLWRELGWNFVLERIVPILLTSWCFWFPCMGLIYSMPAVLQPALFIFGTAIWGLLMPAVARQEREDFAAPAPTLLTTEVLPEPAE